MSAPMCPKPREFHVHIGIIFYLKLWQTDVTTIDFILLSHKYSNLFNLQAFLFSPGLLSVVQLIQAQIKKKIVKFQLENNG